VAAAVADNQANPTPKRIVIVWLEVQRMPPQGYSTSVSFVLVPDDAMTQLGAWPRGCDTEAVGPSPGLGTDQGGSNATRRVAARIDEEFQETPMAFTYLYHMTFHPP